MKAKIELTAAETRLVKSSLRGTPRFTGVHDHAFYGKHIRFGYFSDSHIGEKHFIEPLFERMGVIFQRESIENVYCPGDVFEGMSGRPGHIYELAHVGATAQLDYAEGLFNAFPRLTFHCIAGNHDRWFLEKSNMGLDAVGELAHRCKNVKYLGDSDADVRLRPNIVMKLFHPWDGTAYADSYKMQKLIESFEGGKKPNIILGGNYHKQIAIFRRNVFGFECGTLCGQTAFMRAKKIQAHIGFGIIEIWAGLRGVERLRHEFFPYYD